MSRVATAPVLMSSWSARVDLPWSICAMMEKLRMRSVGTYTNTLRLLQGLVSNMPGSNHHAVHRVPLQLHHLQMSGLGPL